MIGIENTLIGALLKRMNNDPKFPFTFLQSTGGGSKMLTAPSLSAHFKWTAQQVVCLAKQGSVYILSEDELCLPVSLH